MTGRTVPGQETLRRILLFQLQHPDWHLRPPDTGNSAEGKWHASNSTTGLAAGSLAALPDELDWFHAT